MALQIYSSCCQSDNYFSLSYVPLWFKILFSRLLSIIIKETIKRLYSTKRLWSFLYHKTFLNSFPDLQMRQISENCSLYVFLINFFNWLIFCSYFYTIFSIYTLFSYIILRFKDFKVVKKQEIFIIVIWKRIK